MQQRINGMLMDTEHTSVIAAIETQVVAQQSSKDGSRNLVVKTGFFISMANTAFVVKIKGVLSLHIYKWHKKVKLGLVASIGSAGLLLLGGLSPTPAFASSGPYTGALWTQATTNEGVYSYSNTPSYSGGYGPFVGVEDGIGGSQTLSENVGVGWSPQSGGPDYAYEENNVPGYGNAVVLSTTHPTIGTSHAYEIEYLGNNEWGAFIDFQQVVSWIAPSPAYSAYAGIDGEGAPINNTTFTGQTNNSLEFLYTNGSWYDWSGGYIEQASNSSASWVHKYYDETDSVP